MFHILFHNCTYLFLVVSSFLLIVVSRQGTIKSRLLSMTYTTPEAFASDVRLVFNNAVSFNPESHFVHTWAVQLLNEFDVSLSGGDTCEGERQKPGL